MSLLKMKKEAYKAKVYAKMIRRGIVEQDIPRIISTTGFERALDEFPDEQLHLSIKNAVDEIILTAVTN